MIEVKTNIELTSDEKDMLMHIYKVRFRLLFSASVFMIFSAAYSILKLRHTLNQLDTTKYVGVYIAFVSLFIGASAIIIFQKRIWSLKKDAVGGFKEVVLFSITMKQHFPQTNQYFVGLNHPDYLFHEIEEGEFNELNLGDTYGVYRAPNSKYFFNRQGKYSIM